LWYPANNTGTVPTYAFADAGAEWRKNGDDKRTMARKTAIALTLITGDER
jgi:hypothetical protein